MAMRDNFSARTIDALGKRVNLLCSNPDCRRPTAGPRLNPEREVILGVAAHICAAAAGGPRADAGLSAEQRTSADNGIWLCQNCAKLVDSDAGRYTVDVLRQWKQDAEAQAHAALTIRAPGAADVPAPAPAPAEVKVQIDFTHDRSKSNGDYHDYGLKVSVENRTAVPIRDFYIEVTMPKQVLQKDPAENKEYVADRSRGDAAFFRAVYKEGEIFPGDTAFLFNLPYFLNRKLFMIGDRTSLFGFPVTATFVAAHRAPIRVEKKFEELQCF